MCIEQLGQVGQVGGKEVDCATRVSNRHWPACMLTAVLLPQFCHWLVCFQFEKCISDRCLITKKNGSPTANRISKIFKRIPQGLVFVIEIHTYKHRHAHTHTQNSKSEAFSTKRNQCKTLMSVMKTSSESKHCQLHHYPPTTTTSMLSPGSIPATRLPIDRHHTNEVIRWENSSFRKKKNCSRNKRLQKKIMSMAAQSLSL